MSGYLILFVFFLGMISVILDFEKRIPGRIKIFYFNVLCLLLIVVAAMKTERTSSDTANYIMYFKEAPFIQDLKLQGLFSMRLEPGFVILSSVIKSLGGSYHAFFAVEAIIVVGLYRTIILKYSKYKFLSLFVYISCYFFMNEIVVLRQGMATALIFYNIENIVERKYVKAILIVIFSSLFHAEGLIGFLPIILVWINRDKMSYSAINIILFFGISILLYFIGPWKLAELLATIVPVLQYRIQKMIIGYRHLPEASIRYRRFILYLPFFVLAFLELKGVKKDKVYSKSVNILRLEYVIYNYILSAYFCLISFGKINELNRFSTLLLSAIIISSSCNVAEQTDKKSKIILILVFMVIYLYIFVRQNFFNSNGIPLGVF